MVYIQSDFAVITTVQLLSLNPRRTFVKMLGFSEMRLPDCMVVMVVVAVVVS